MCCCEAIHQELGFIRQEAPPTRPPIPGSADVRARKWQRKTRNRPWRAIAEHLKYHQGEWWVVGAGRYASLSDTAVRIRQGIAWWGPAGVFAAAVRSNATTAELYVQYVGPK